MSTHTSRLQNDLDLVRLLAALVDEDATADVAAIVETASANLQKCRHLQRNYTRFDDAVEYGRDCAKQLGVPFVPPRRPSSAESETIEQDLALLRGLLAHAVNSISVRETRRLIHLCIAAEKRLWRENVNSGLYLSRDATVALGNSLADQLIAGRGELPNWNDRVDNLLAQPEGEQR